MARIIIPTDEAFWQGHARVWASIQQYPPKKDRSSWWLVLAGLGLVTLFFILNPGDFR